MITAIKIRDALMTLGGTAFPEIPPKNRETRKQDKVEKWPFLSVYLDDLISSKGAMKGCRSREQSITIALYRKGEVDLEDTFSKDLETFENLVEAERRKGSFGDSVSIHLTGGGFNFPPDSKNRFGALVMTFTATYSHNVG